MIAALLAAAAVAATPCAPDREVELLWPSRTSEPLWVQPTIVAPSGIFADGCPADALTLWRLVDGEPEPVAVEGRVECFDDGARLVPFAWLVPDTVHEVRWRLPDGTTGDRLFVADDRGPPEDFGPWDAPPWLSLRTEAGWEGQAAYTVVRPYAGDVGTQWIEVALEVLDDPALDRRLIVEADRRASTLGRCEDGFPAIPAGSRVRITSSVHADFTLWDDVFEEEVVVPAPVELPPPTPRCAVAPGGAWVGALAVAGAMLQRRRSRQGELQG